MPIHRLPAAEALHSLHTFDDVIDARSPAEWALDALPGAINWPTLDNDQRIEVGTMYKQVGAFEAKKRGAAMAAINIGQHITTHGQDKPKHWKPLVYCWRGGNRSGALATVLSAIGFHVTLVEGGYKAWRHALVADFTAKIAPLHFHVICGPTGSAKTRLLHRIAAHGGQVLDLEALASHRSSVLGAWPGTPQPTQKQFDTRLWVALHDLDPKRPVFVECESKRIGNVAMPDDLATALHASPCVRLEVPMTLRAEVLTQEYTHLCTAPEHLNERLSALTMHLGKVKVAELQTMVAEHDWHTLVQTLLSDHYDPAYRSSIDRHFTRHNEAPVHSFDIQSMGAFDAQLDELAQRLSQISL